MSEVPINLHPKLFKSIDQICRLALSYGQNHSEIRKAIGTLCLFLQQEYPEPSVELVTLRALLRRTDSRYDPALSVRPEARQDPVHQLGLGEHPKLGPDQQASALQIKKIWTAFSRFLAVAARNLEGGGTRKNKALDPIDVMSHEVAELWETTYIPWYTKGSRTYLGRTGINEADVTLRVVVEGVFPNELDRIYGLPNGSALAALRHQLILFYDSNYDARQVANVAAD